MTRARLHPVPYTTKGCIQRYMFVHGGAAAPSASHSHTSTVGNRHQGKTCLPLPTHRTSQHVSNGRSSSVTWHLWPCPGRASSPAHNRPLMHPHNNSHARLFNPRQDPITPPAATQNRQQLDGIRMHTSGLDARGDSSSSRKNMRAVQRQQRLGRCPHKRGCAAAPHPTRTLAQAQHSNYMYIYTHNLLLCTARTA